MKDHGGQGHNTYLTRWPVCPWCGHENRDAWEESDAGLEYSECGKCERPYTAQRHVDITYSTHTTASRPTEGRDGASTHERGAVEQ